MTYTSLSHHINESLEKKNRGGRVSIDDEFGTVKHKERGQQFPKVEDNLRKDQGLYVVTWLI